MTPKSNYLFGGAALLAAMIVALPAAKGIGTARKDAPLVEVNRSAKGDRYVQPRTIAVRKAPVAIDREPISMRTPKELEKPAANPEKIMDGCEPYFSPVVVPSMAHLAARCVG